MFDKKNVYQLVMARPAGSREINLMGGEWGANVDV